MPLLGDSKSVYVGTTPITKVMAAGVQVWPKGPPPPFSNLRLYLTAPSNPSISQGFFIAWTVPVRPSNCSRASAYEYRYTKIETTYPDDKWGPWWTFPYVPYGCTSWMPRTGEFENNLVTILTGFSAVLKPYVKIQLRHTNNGIVTTSEEYTFSLTDPLGIPPLPPEAMDYCCPEPPP